MGGLIRADLDGLSKLAATCQTQAAVLADASAVARPPACPFATPTTTAIVTAQAHVSAAAARFAQRMKVSADRFGSAATDFATAETDSTRALGRVV